MNIGSNAICCLTVIPVRASNNDTSEIVTQLLFGELLTVIGIQNQWIKVKIFHDGYEGWVDNKQLLAISESTFSNLKKNKLRQQKGILRLNTPWGVQNVVQGSPILSDSNNFNIEKNEFSWVEDIPQNVQTPFLDLVFSYLNAPYLWGGRTQFGIDCSGFTQTVFHQFGYNLPRDASQQFFEGIEIEFKNQKEGDLAFFKSEKTGNIHHVGIVLSENKIIHAHGRVRIDTLTEKGILNEEKEYYSHNLEKITRLSTHQ